MPDTDHSAHATAPTVWLLFGRKAGDNNQVLALAEALGWPYEIKRFEYQPFELLANLCLRTTLAGIRRERSSALAPPWPDLVITAGRRNEPVARWIRRQSGDRTRLVHIGRPWAPLDCFDLIVTNAQYFLPLQPNILHNRLPLHRISRERLEAEAAQWRERLAHLPRPHIAVLIGGDSGKFVFTPDKGQRLGQQVNALCRAEGGSLLVTDSARTPTAAFAAFCDELTVPSHLHSCRSSSPDDSRGNNPYLAYLALADQLVVTGESMSMLTEAAATGKPLAIFDLSDAPERPWWRYLHNFRHKPLSHRLAMRFGPRRMRREIGNIQQALIDGGYAVWLGQPFKPANTTALPDGAAAAAQRVRELFASGRRGRP